jgi:hypothetical protein
MTESAISTPTPARQLNGARPPKSRRKPLRINRQRIARMEAIVEGLLRLLDEVDGDPDEEPEESGYGDLAGMIVEEVGEPSLGWTLDGDISHGSFDEEEPSLGWTLGIKQEGPSWRGDTDDREDEHDGREPEHEEGDGSLVGGDVPLNMHYDGSGHAIARKQLVKLRAGKQRRQGSVR